MAVDRKGTAFVLYSDGNIFLCVGSPTRIEFIGLKSAAPVVAEEPDAEEEDLLDFSLV